MPPHPNRPLEYGKHLSGQTGQTPRATLQDIASALDVSPSLVSKVLNRRFSGRSSASQAMSGAIFAKARELDYRANSNALSMQLGRQDAVAVFVHDHGVPGSELTSRTVKAVARRAALLHQRLMLQYYSLPEEFSELAAQAHPSTVDGLVLIGIALRQPSDALENLVRRRLPVVTVYDHAIHPQFPNFGLDPGAIARSAVAHLAEQGCRRIALLGTHLGAARRQGFLKALAEAGLSVEEALLAPQPGLTADVGEETVRAWLAEGRAFDGVAAFSDQLAAGAINALTRADVRVPEQVKVVGVDDSPFCEFFPVPITSVSQEVALRGDLALDALHRLIRGECVGSSAVAPKLRVRASSGGANFTHVHV